MKNILRLNNIAEYNKILGQETLHPLISVIDFSKCGPVNHGSLNFGFMVFFAPNQVISVENKGAYFQPI